MKSFKSMKKLTFRQTKLPSKSQASLGLITQDFLDKHLVWIESSEQKHFKKYFRTTKFKANEKNCIGTDCIFYSIQNVTVHNHEIHLFSELFIIMLTLPRVYAKGLFFRSEANSLFDESLLKKVSKYFTMSFRFQNLRATKQL